MTRRKWWCLAASLVVLSLLVGVTGVTIRDTFDNGVINTSLWRKDRFGGINLAERNGRLEFVANGHTGSRSAAYLETRDWGANWLRDFTAAVSFRFNVQPTLLDHRITEAGLALRFSGEYNNTNFTGITAGIQRTNGLAGSGLFLVSYLWQDGSVVASKRVLVNNNVGRLVISYDQSADRIGISGVGQHLTWLNVSGMLPVNPQTPVVITIGALTRNGSGIEFDGDQVSLDNFAFIGTRRFR